MYNQYFRECLWLGDMGIPVKRYVTVKNVHSFTWSQYENEQGASDWVEILSREIPSSIVESATDSGAQCAGILTGIHLKILTAECVVLHFMSCCLISLFSIGADWNPQATIGKQKRKRNFVSRYTL